jgi:hypothetical protein
MNDPSLVQFYFHPNNPSNINPFTSRNFEMLNGINNLSISKSVSVEQQNLLGYGNVFPIPNAPCEFSVSFDRSFICRDPLLFLTGTSPLINSYLKQDDRIICFNYLFLTNYSAGFSVGELPVINTKFVSYDERNADSIPSLNLFSLQRITQSIPAVPDSQVPNLGSIKITGTCASELLANNNIFSFDYSLDIKRQPYFGIGKRGAISVETIFPINISFSINSKIASYSNLKTWPGYLDTSYFGSANPNDGKYYDFDIVVSGSTLDVSYPVRCAKLISTEIQNSSTSTAEIKRNFIGYYGV